MTAVFSMAFSGSCDLEHAGAICRMRSVPAPLATTASFVGGGPREIARVALFLAGDMSSWVTAQTIMVDGGQLLS
jgi:NAD(P)-dependent dehydrogenase (short-subunit alcohol dehydrogenase family)